MLVREALVFDSNNGITPVGSRVNTLVNCCWRISAFPLSVNLKEVPSELSSRNGAMLIFVFNFRRTYDQKTLGAYCDLLTISFSNFHFCSAHQASNFVSCFFVRKSVDLIMVVVYVVDVS